MSSLNLLFIEKQKFSQFHQKQTLLMHACESHILNPISHLKCDSLYTINVRFFFLFFRKYNLKCGIN
jgi:hypothetical protein